MGGAERVVRLDCPIPPRLSPHADDAGEWLARWITRFDLPLDRSAARRMAEGGFARYVGRLYPDATAADLRALAALITWFFLVDDACDGSAARVRQVRALRDGTLRLLRTGGRNRGFTGPLRRMLADVWRILRGRMPAAWRDRFTDAVAHHFDGVLTEADNRAAGHRPTVEEYVTLRRASSGAYVSYTLTEFATGLPLPDAVYHHPAVRAVAATGNDLLSWFNDLLSLERDAATSAGHNLVLAVAHERALPVGEAVRVVVRHWQETMRRFTELRQAVPRFGPTVDEPLRHYLDGVANSVRGTIDWSLESGRYRGAGIELSVPAPEPAPPVRDGG